jgi:hypothetical protein
MRIEIFVVKTLNPDQNRLDKLKEALIRLFGGLTIIPNCEGFFLDKNTQFGTIWHDKTEIWQIYTDFKEKTVIKALEPYLARIKNATRQTTQAYALNENLRLI